jgi:hypothetical protein
MGRVDRRLPMKHGITAGQRPGEPAPYTPIGGSGPGHRFDPPRIQHHAREIANVVGAEVGDEHRLQAPAIDGPGDARRLCSTTTVDNETALVDHER